jgi:stage II sporulation protein AA (anti-sigma F factor antagonist)
MGLSVKFYIRKNSIFIRLIGDMDQESVGNLRDKLVQLIKEKNVKNIVFNMKDLEFMDSTGIGIIIGRYNQLKLKGGKVILCSINKTVERIILLSGLPRICIIKENEDSAINYLEEIYG